MIQSSKQGLKYYSELELWILFQDDDAGDRIHAQDREAIKRLIVNLMLHSPEAIQKQLSDAVSIVGRHDFPNKWPDLISQMVEKFATGTYILLDLDLNTHWNNKFSCRFFSFSYLWFYFCFVKVRYFFPSWHGFRALTMPVLVPDIKLCNMH